MTAVSNRDLHIEFLLVQADAVTPVPDIEPEAWASIAGVGFKRLGFPITEIGRGWYRFIIPGRYIGGDNPILIEATGMDALMWRDSIAMEQFLIDGGDLFEQEPLPDVEEVEPPDQAPEPEPEPEPEGDWGENQLHNAAWTFNDRSAGGSMVQSGNKIVVTLGPDNGRTRQLYTTLPVQDGEHRLQVIGSSTADFNLTPAIIMHAAPYDRLTDPATLPKIKMIPGGINAVLDFDLDPYDPARVRITFPKTIPAGTEFTFEAITLRKLT